MAFILFTEAVNQFPAGNVWAVLFFLMLFTLGLDSQFGTLQGVVQCFIDLKLFPNLRKEILTGKIWRKYEYRSTKNMNYFNQFSQQILWQSPSFCIRSYLLCLPNCVIDIRPRSWKLCFYIVRQLLW